jgi:hypothetical protein
MLDTTRKQAHLAAASQLLEQLRLKADEVVARFEKATLPSYWESLNPRLSVNKNEAPDGYERATITAPRLRELAGKLAEEGYFQLDPLPNEDLVERMREAIVVLKKHDWPPVFAFVYDEFWRTCSRSN